MNSYISYSKWRDENKYILQDLADKDVYMLFSGGKDSSLAMDFILRAGKEFEFAFRVHAGAFPVHRYTENERERIDAYWGKRGVNIIWHKVDDSDDAIDKDKDPCGMCQKKRKIQLNSIVDKSAGNLERIVLVVSYSLWDIVSYSVEHMLSNLFSCEEMDGGGEKRFLETSQRFYPFLKMKEGYAVFRPLVKYNGIDIEKTIEQSGIPTLSTPCRYGNFRPKRILESYYNKMGLRFDYDRVIEYAKKSHNLPGISGYSAINAEEYLSKIF